MLLLKSSVFTLLALMLISCSDQISETVQAEEEVVEEEPVTERVVPYSPTIKMAFSMPLDCDSSESYAFEGEAHLNKYMWKFIDQDDLLEEANIGIHSGTVSGEVILSSNNGISLQIARPDFGIVVKPTQWLYALEISLELYDQKKFCDNHSDKVVVHVQQGSRVLYDLHFIKGGTNLLDQPKITNHPELFSISQLIDAVGNAQYDELKFLLDEGNEWKNHIGDGEKTVESERICAGCTNSEKSKVVLALLEFLKFSKTFPMKFPEKNKFFLSEYFDWSEGEQTIIYIYKDVYRTNSDEFPGVLPEYLLYFGYKLTATGPADEEASIYFTRARTEFGSQFVLVPERMYDWDRVTYYWELPFYIDGW